MAKTVQGRLNAEGLGQSDAGVHRGERDFDVARHVVEVEIAVRVGLGPFTRRHACNGRGLWLVGKCLPIGANPNVTDESVGRIGDEAVSSTMRMELGCWVNLDGEPQNISALKTR